MNGANFMTMTIWNTRLMMQQGGNATTQPATTQNPSAGSRQDVQRARDLGEAIRSRVQDQVDAAQIEKAVNDGLAGAFQGAPVVAPTPPPAPHTITIRGANGKLETITISPRAFQDTIPREAVTISVAFFLMMAVIIIGLPLARAFARRVDRKGAGASQMPGELTSQLAHLNQSIDAIALEVERISEGQRFTTRLLSEQKESARQSLPTGTNR
jgi:hypothetical protein